VKVRFLPADTVVEVAAGTTLFEAAGAVGLGVDTACVGKGTCGLCRVKVIDGAPALSPYSDEEERHLGNLYRITKLRLACRTRVLGDCTVEIVTKKKK
jgi:ferredoxin